MRKIFFKIFLMFNILILVLFLTIVLSNRFFLEEYYLNYKKNQVEDIAKAIDKNPSIDQEDVMRKNNVKMFYIDEHKYHMTMRRLFYNQKTMPPKRMMGRDKEPEILPAYTELTEKGELITFRGFNKGEKFIVFLKKVGNKALIIHSPVFAINEAVKVSSRFLGITFAFGLILSTLLSFYLSKRISSPIKDIDFVANEMTKLNFDNKLDIHRKDELGTLSKSINSLSTKLKSTIDDLQISNERLQLEVEKEKEIDKLRREFVSNVNHELKTPIAIIEGYAEGLMDNIASEEDKNFYCEVIVDECKKMDELVKSLLLASKYDNKFIELNKEEFDLDIVIIDLLRKYRLDIEYKNLEVVTNMAKVEVYGDKKELATAIDNYLSNAINYTKEYQRIDIELTEDNENINFSVKNPSEEISQNQLEKLFDPFSKLDKARTRKYGGTGLGLSIVKKIIDLHKGEYGAKFDNDIIEFFIRLPKKKQSI